MAPTDFGNTYLHEFTKEKIYRLTGTEFGEWEGHITICVISVYGLKKSMARWHEAISDKLKLIGFSSSKEDLDLWIQDTGYHYDYITVYYDDLIVLSKDLTIMLRLLDTLFPLKGV